jgi:hypothetical protein
VEVWLQKIKQMNTGRQKLAGAGTQTLGLAFGGFTTINLANTEEYDGTVWVTAPSMATARRELTGAGTQTAGLAFGGVITTASAATEEYNGETTALNTESLTTS